MIQDIEIKVTRQRLYLDDNVTYGRAITYGSGSTMSDMKMTLLRHRAGTGIKYPAIVFLCGGGWVTQDFNAHILELVDYAEAGYVVASVQYRLAGECRFPAALYDIKAAIRYLRAHAEELNIDANRIGVMGESAGGHLASFVGVTGKTREFDQGDYLEQSSAVQAVCCLYPPVDLKLMAEQINERDANENAVYSGKAYISAEAIAIGNDPLTSPDLVARANPLKYLDESAPPFCILHGTADRTVPTAQGELLHHVLEATGVPVTMYRVKNAPHAGIEFFQPELKALVLSFFDKALK